MSSPRLALVAAALALPHLVVAPARAADLFLYRDPDGRARIVDRPPARVPPPASELGWGARPDVLRYEPAPPRARLQVVGTRRSIRVEDPPGGGFRAVQDPGVGPARPGR